MDMTLSKVGETVKDREAWRAARNDLCASVFAEMAQGTAFKTK